MPGTEAPSNPAGPAGGIPDGLRAAFDQTIDDLGLNDDLDAAPETSDEPVVEAPADPEPAPEAEPSAAPARSTKQEQPRVPQPAPRQPQAKTTTEPAAAPVAAPEGMAPEKAEAFAKLAPEAQAFVREMHDEFTQRAGVLSQWANYARQVRSLITDEHRERMTRGGFKSEVEAIAHLIQLNEVATNDFPRYARWALGQYGNGDIAAAVRAIAPEVFGDVEEGAGEAYDPRPRPAAPDPVQRQVLDTLGNVVRRLDGYDEYARNQRLQAADQVIASFRVEKDAQGQPKYPYLKEVETVVARIVRQPEYRAIADPRERLAAAYDAAVAFVPAVRAKAQAAERTKWEAEQKRLNEVARARKAKSVISSPTTGAAKAGPGGLDGALNLAMSQLRI